MNALLVCFFAACFAAIANLFFRKSSEGSSEKNCSGYYLLFFYFISFVVSFFLSPSTEPAPFSPIMFSLGCLVGILNVSMMWFTSRALLTGPAGLTFAFQNASGVFPGILLFTLFGPLFGFQMTFFQIMGICLVVGGLFLGSASRQKENSVSIRWLKYAFGCLVIQIFALSLIQWRCLLYASHVPAHYLIPWNLPECSDAWFLPGQFGTAFFLQLGMILLFEKKVFVLREASYGALGGFANVASSVCLLISTKTALPLEKGLIFPCFAASTMILCNIWANRFYEERFNVAANCCCASGIFLASLI